MPDRLPPADKRSDSRKSAGKSRHDVHDQLPLPEKPPLDIALHSIGRFLKSMRESLGMTQEQVAAGTEGRPWTVSRATIGAVEAGRSAPTMTTIMAITEVLHVDPLEVWDRLKLAAAAPQGDGEISSEQLDDSFRNLFHSGHFRQALAVLDRIASTMAPRLNREVGTEARRHMALLEMRRATTLKRLGALTAAARSAERAIESSSDFPDILADSFSAIADIYLRQGNIPMGVHAAATAVKLSESCEPRVVANAWVALGRARWESSQYEESRQAFLHTREIAEELDDPNLLIQSEGNIGSCLAKLGHIRHAEEQIHRAVELARRHRRPEKEAIWLVESGKCALENNRPDEAERWAVEALRIARKHEHYETVFRAVMLQHRVAKSRNPHDPDRHRLSYLKKLHARMDEHIADPDVVEFLREISNGNALGEESAS